MRKRRFAYVLLKIFIVIFALSHVTSCNGSATNSSQRGSVQNVQALGTKTSDEIYDLGSALETSDLGTFPEGTLEGSIWDWTKFILYFGDILLNAEYALEYEKITYSSEDAYGNQVILSALLILPFKDDGSSPNLPILSYQHVTEPYRDYAPSKFLDNIFHPTNYPEVLIASAMAATGFIVIMPDYQGMGNNTDQQPFMHGRTLAISVVDAIRAARNRVGSKSLTVNLNTGVSPATWNNKLFLVGYSEGGYVTTVTARELQLNHPTEFTVNAVSPCAGPHDLSGVLRDTMISDDTYKAPYFLPMVIQGYWGVYRNDPDPEIAHLFDADVVYQTPYSSTLPQKANGDSTGQEINLAMGMTYDPVSFIVPKSVLLQSFVDQLSNDESAVFGILRTNDSYLTDASGELLTWVPSMPLRMFHHIHDDLIYYQNSVVALNAFNDAGAPDVSLIEETVTIDIGNESVKTVHGGAALPALHDAWRWIYDNFQ